MIVTDSSHLKKELTRLLLAAAAGEEVVVTYRGHRVARLVPYEKQEERLIQRPRDPAAPRPGEIKIRRILPRRQKSWSAYLDRAPVASADFMEGVEDPPPRAQIRGRNRKTRR